MDKNLILLPRSCRSLSGVGIFETVTDDAFRFLFTEKSCSIFSRRSICVSILRFFLDFKYFVFSLLWKLLPKQCQQKEWNYREYFHGEIICRPQSSDLSMNMFVLVSSMLRWLRADIPLPVFLIGHENTNDGITKETKVWMSFVKIKTSKSISRIIFT